MRTKKRYIDVVSPTLKFLDEIEKEKRVSFEDILNFMDGKEYRYRNEKIFECSILKTSIPNCIVGIIVSTLDRDIPPIRGKSSKIFSSVDIDPRTEGLAFGNVFIYDKDLNILLYEMNKNGCFLNQFKDFIYAKWKEIITDEVDISKIESEDKEEDRVKFDLTFATFLRKNEYIRMLKMDYFKKITVELCNPTELIHCFDEENLSLEENLLKSQIETGVNNNANTVTLEQVTLGKKINPLGLSRKSTIGMIDAIKTSIADKGYKKNINTIEVEGYFSDMEGETRSLKPIDLMADTFNEFFKIPDIQVQVDVQEYDRQIGIEGLYNTLLPEIKTIIGCQ